MKKVELQPKKVKGMGNLLKFLKKEDFSLHGCGIENSYYPPTVAGTEFPAFIIDHPILGLNLVVTAANSSIFPSDDSSGGTPTSTTISATVTTSSGVPIQNHTVYFEENNNRFATSTTNSSGIATATYSSNLHGARTINVRVLKQSGYEGKSQNISVFVKLPTNLTLSPPNMSLTFFETRDLTARLTDARNGQVIGGRNVNFYNGSALLGSATTDNNGIATLSINNPLLVQNPDTFIFSDDMSGSNPQDKYNVSGNIQLSYVTFGGRRALKLDNNGFAYLKNVTLPANFVMRYDLYRVSSATTDNNIELKYNQQDANNRCTVNHANSPVVALQKQKNGTWSDIDTDRIPQLIGGWVRYELRVVNGRHTLKNLDTGEYLSGVENDLLGGSIYFTKTTGLYYVSNITIDSTIVPNIIFEDNCTIDNRLEYGTPFSVANGSESVFNYNSVEQSYNGSAYLFVPINTSINDEFVLEADIRGRGKIGFGIPANKYFAALGNTGTYWEMVKWTGSFEGANTNYSNMNPNTFFHYKIEVDNMTMKYEVKNTANTVIYTGTWTLPAQFSKTSGRKVGFLLMGTTGTNPPAVKNIKMEGV